MTDVNCNACGNSDEFLYEGVCISCVQQEQALADEADVDDEWDLGLPACNAYEECEACQ